MCVSSKGFFLLYWLLPSLESNHVICRSKSEKVDRKHNNNQIYVYLITLNKIKL